MRSNSSIVTLALVLQQVSTTKAFQSFFKIPSFQPPNNKGNTISNENELLNAVSNTANGKDASPAQQKAILNLVREMETLNAPDEDILTNPDKTPLLDGTWYLQYTSPSDILVENEKESQDDDDNDDVIDVDLWKPTIAEDARINTKQYEAKGSVTAAGISVDVSNKVPRQIFDIEKGLFFNEVDLDFGFVRVGGPFKLSDKVSNRVLASFKECKIDLNIGLKLDLGFVFYLTSLARGTSESGWLETTYLTEKVRIGRGNKGTMFVLTRDKDAVLS